MNYDIPYDRGISGFELPDTCRVKVFNPRKVASFKPDDFIVKKEKRLLDSFFKVNEKVLIIVNDATRPTPNEDILMALEKWTKLSDITFIVATGTHKDPTTDDLHQIFGRYYPIYKDKILIHNCHNEDGLIFLGETKLKTPVFINRIVFEFDKIMIINSVEPHYFAGFTGARKSFMPGVSGFKTIEANHKHALHENSAPLKLEGNPVNEDMWEVAGFIKADVLSVMAVLNDENKIHYLSFGDMRQTFNECVEIAGKLFTVKVNEPADIIITAAHYPMDVNLYQSLKAIQNTKSVLKEGGVIILVSKCRAGIGNDDFIKHLKSESEPCELILKIEKAYNDNMFVPLGYHISGKLMKLLGRANIFVVSDISDEIVNDISFKSFKNIQQAVDEAVKITGRNSEVYIFRAGSITIPVIG